MLKPFKNENYAPFTERCNIQQTTRTSMRNCPKCQKALLVEHRFWGHQPADSILEAHEVYVWRYACPACQYYADFEEDS